MLGDKLRFRFAKTGTLRLLSHHDLMRCLERMFRRADLPFKSTAGFHPSPRIVFALSLPLGVVGLDEVVEIEFTRACDSEDVFAQLNAQAPDGLTFTRGSVVAMKATALPRRVTYALALPADRADVVWERCRELMARDKIWVDRLKPGPKRLNVRPYLRGLGVVGPHPPSLECPHPPTPSPRERGGANQSPLSPLERGLEEEGVLGSEYASLTCDFWVTQTGTARADELVKLLGVADLLDAGVVLQRTTIELRDEVTALDPTDQPPDGPADTLPLEPAAIAALTRQDEEQTANVSWGASPSEPVVE